MTDVYLLSPDGSQRLPLAGGPLGVGGQARVYAVDSDPTRVVKLYRTPNEERTKRLLHMLLAHRPEDFMVGADRHPVLVWPSALVHDANGRAVGYVMRRVGPPEQLPLFTLFTRRQRLASFPDASWRFLVGVARNLAGLVVQLHRQDLVVGDLSHNNLMVSRNGFVTLLDCDSIQFRHDGQFFACATSTMEYAAPELQVDPSAPRSPATDDFTLAVLVCRLLTAGDHPFIGHPAQVVSEEPSPGENIRLGLSYLVRPTAVRVPRETVDAAVLPPAVAALARRAFGPGIEDPTQRPSAAEWHQTLRREWSLARICDRRPRHTYGAHLGACPWCARITAGTADLFYPPEPAHDQGAQPGTGIPVAAWLGVALFVLMVVVLIALGGR
jgi:eukaryotic-like serine/threonine-protein kinase